MKRIVGILVILALLMAAPTAYAKKTDTLTSNGVSSSGAYATYEETDPNVFHTASDKDGNFVVKRDEKTTVTVDPVNDRSGHKLVIHFFIPGDQNAIDWLDETINGLDEDISPFEAYYLDANGNRVELEKGDQISMTVETTDIIIKSVAPDGSVVELPFAVNGNTITFKAPGGKFCYYAVGLKAGAVAPPPTNPDTGILFDEVSWFAIMMMCASALGVLLLVRKRALDLEIM